MIESTWRVRGWVQVVMAALAMVATLPGRTHGLGMITEPLLKDLHLERTTFAHVNLFATLVGALFCFPAGQLLDRYGSRSMLTALLVALSACVWCLGGVTSFVPLLVLITLTRGLGQSALSVVSISMVGKWFDRRLGLATALYSVLLSLGFMAAFHVIGGVIREQDWRAAWADIAGALLALAPLSWLLVRWQPAALPTTASAREEPVEPAAVEGFETREALRTPAFWVFAGAASLYLLASSGLGLFNQSIFAEHGFDRDTYLKTLKIAVIASLVGQMVCGGLAQRWSYQRVTALALALYAAALLGLTHVETLTQLYVCVVLLGVSGGMIAVMFYAVWAHAFGRRELGRIQGAAQMMTVFASAAGPLVFAQCHDKYTSYDPALYALAAVVLAAATIALLTPWPGRAPLPSAAEVAAVA